MVHKCHTKGILGIKQLAYFCIFYFLFFCFGFIIIFKN